MDCIDKVGTLINTLEGRDKVGKAFQYLIKILISSSNKELIEKLTPSFSKYLY